ncbi:MAG TPA: two-component regulator propeller domain-containing protein [Lacunisphaera sp.]|jgi:signal transduction histidine kinase/ligand-binding sensor domain-containing protein|nr:two-component regulator propeller domain-containing protein [Lacunisphaera sp.]
MSALARSSALLALALVLAAGESFPSTILANGYSLRVWQTEDGLPQNKVTSAVQTRDGYLWFGTESGLARFDGESFRVFDSINAPALPDRRITALFEDAQGSLWIGHESGAITRWRHGRFETVRLPAAAGHDDYITGLGSDEQGRLWAMHKDGAIESLDEARTRLPSLIAPDLPAVMAWTRGAQGSIWVVENGTTARLENNRLTPLPLPPPQVSNSNYAQCVGASARGGVWVLCDGRIRRWDHGAWVEDPSEAPPSGGHLCLELHDGTLAIGTIHAGLYLIFPDGRHPVHFDRSNGLPQDWVRFLYQDREDNLWIGVGSGGVVSIHPTAFSVLHSPDRWLGCSILAVAPGREGALWIGTDGAGLYRNGPGGWTHYGEAEGLGNPYLWAVAESPDGDVWASNYWPGGPYKLENGRFVRPDYVSPATSIVFALLASAGTDAVLVGNRDGLLQLKDQRATLLVRPPHRAAGAVCAIARDRAGAVWCGFAEGGLARLVDGHVTYFQRKDGLASDAVQCLFADDDGTLWIGTADNGLSRFRQGRFANVGVAQNLADNVVCHLVDDGRGYLWLSTHHGIQRIEKAELNRCADGAIPAVSGQVFDQDDGLPTIEFTGGVQAAGCRTTDGRLWFASSKGVLGVDPAQIEPNRTPPPVVIDSLRVDGTSVPVDGGAGVLRLPPDHERLEFRFSGLSFVAPKKVLFKYRLDGIDRSWSRADARRSAFYSRLPAGTYRLHVTACNNDGLWNPTGASLAFTVAPFFWQTWWFRVAAALAGVSAVAGLARYLTRRRLQRQIEAMERQHELERERARIAQDIHDDVGATLSRIAMLSQPARADLARPERTATVLDNIYTTAREVTRALDEIVWAVDPRHDTLDSLADYMGRYAHDFLTTAGVRCRLDLPATVPAWPLTAETRHNLFLAFKEALHNTVKHAAATEVHIALRVEPDAFALTVRDNGRGLGGGPPDSSGSDRLVSGHGLANMKRRLARIGGRCEISPAAGGGTSVALVVPNLGRTPSPGPHSLP